MRLKLLVISIALFVGVGSWGQTAVSYAAMTTITCPATPVATISPSISGLTFSQISRGAGVTCGAAGGSISGSGFNDTLAANITANAWYTFSITSNASTPFTLNSLSLISQVSTATGSPNVSVHYSIGAGAKTVIGSYTPTATSTTYTITPGSAIAVGASQVLNIFIIPNALNASTTTCRITNASSVTVNSGYTTQANGDWNTGTTWTGGIVPPAGANCTVNHAVTLAASLNNTGTIAVSATGSLQLNPGGYVSGTSIVYATTGSTLIFNNSGSLYGVSSGQAFWPIINPPCNVTISGSGAQTNMTVGALAGTLTLNSQLNAVNAVTVNGTLQLNAGGYVSSNPPTYGSSSTLVYNTTYAVGTEWTANSTTAGSGIPQNVTIQNSSAVTMPNSNRGMAGNLNISSGNLALNAASGDLYLGGSWTRASAASFTPNNRAVFFNGSGTQTITVSASGTETFNFLLVQGSGTLRLATNVVVNSSSGLTLGSTHLSSTIDLNGQTLTLSGGGNVNLNAGNRFITSSAANGKFTITSNTITVTNGGTLTTAATNTTIDLQNGLDCGTGSLVTINGTLQINANGFCVGNSPKYGASSLLQYNSGINPYNRQLEWTGNGTTAGTGIPQNVQISNNTTLNYINAANSGPKGIAGNLTIDSGSSLFMDFGNTSSFGALTLSGNLISAGNMTLGFANGDDLRIAGNITFNTGYSFDAKGRAIIFTKAGTQTITASSKPTFNYVNLTSGTTTVQLSGTDLDITAPLAGNVISFSATNDTFDINGRTLTLGTSAIANAISGPGAFKGSPTSNVTLLGTGSIGALSFKTSFQDLGTLTMNRQAATVGCTMGSAVTINMALNLTNGLIDLGANTMTLTSTCSNTFGDSANSFVISDVTAGGNLRKNTTATGITYRFPVGDKIGTTEYSPATVNFAAGTFSSAYLGIAVEDYAQSNGQHSSLYAASDYISRSWKLTTSGTFNSPTYTIAADYFATDVNGLETNCVATQWNGTTWTDGGSTGTNSLTFIGNTTTPSPNYITKGRRDQEIRVERATAALIPSGSNASPGYDTDFGSQTIATTSGTKTYTIRNIGNSNLTVSNPTLIGTNPGDFNISSASSLTIVAGGTATFTVTFTPTMAGTRIATVRIVNNDSDENPYTFDVTGDGTCPTTTNPITPTSGPVGTEVTINATANDLTGATASFNGTNAVIVSSTATKLVVLVPPIATTGNLVVTNSTGCQATNAFAVIDNKANSCQGGTVATDLFISEVTDATTGGLSYIEIYNGTSSATNMNGYSLFTSFNGGTSTTTLPLNNFILNPGLAFVVAVGITASPSTFNTCSINGGNGSLADQTSANGSINFDPGGNDYIGLLKNSTATIIDSFGSSTNATWADGLGLGDRGATFRRKNTASLIQPITYSNSDWNITDWVGSAQSSCNTNDYSDVGVYNFMSGPPPTVTKDPSYSWNCKIATSLNVEGQEGYDLPGDTKNLTYQWLVSAPGDAGWTEITSTTNGSIYTNFNSATLNISNISNVLNYQYYCQIREDLSTCYKGSKAVKITDGGTTTWNGSWTNGLPIIDKLVIIDANYNTSTLGLGSFSACSVVVNSGKTFTITGNKYVKIQNDLTNNGTVTIKNNGSLVQVNDNGVNTGNIRFERTTPLVTNTDYTYWASPVAGYTLGGVSKNLTVEDKYYSFNSTIDDWEQASASTTMNPGIGYIIRGPEPTGPIPPGPDYFDAFFTGVPNNGAYPISGLVANKSYLLGNPYPSALDADKFLEDNAGVLNGTLYFWTHNTPLDLAANISNPGPNWAYAYSFDDYAAYNITGGVGIDPGTVTESAPSDPQHSVSGNDLGKKPTGKIASGQGFFASSKTTLSGSEIVFNNSMRVGVVDILKEDNSQFFKTRNPKTKTATFEKHRIWLNLTNTQGVFKQALVGYITDATNQYDNRFDGISFDGNEFVDFYSVNQEMNLVIQGRALPFDDSDEVPLGFRTTIEGAFTIKIDQADGVLTNQAVFIEDKLTNTIFNLRSGPFTFNTAAGTFKDRFVLRYTNKTLGTKDVESPENQVLVSNKNKQIKINSNTEAIDKVVFYDLLGRLLFKKDKVNNTEFSILNLISNSETLLVKVTLQNGETVTRKILY